MRVIDVHDAKTHLSRLLERAEAGEEIVITRGGRPVAKLVGVVTERSKRKPGLLKGRIRVPKTFNTPLPGAVLDTFEGR